MKLVQVFIIHGALIVCCGCEKSQQGADGGAEINSSKGTWSWPSVLWKLAADARFEQAFPVTKWKLGDADIFFRPLIINGRDCYYVNADANTAFASFEQHGSGKFSKIWLLHGNLNVTIGEWEEIDLPDG